MYKSSLTSAYSMGFPGQMSTHKQGKSPRPLLNMKESSSNIHQIKTHYIWQECFFWCKKPMEKEICLNNSSNNFWEAGIVAWEIFCLFSIRNVHLLKKTIIVVPKTALIPTCTAILNLKSNVIRTVSMFGLVLQRKGHIIQEFSVVLDWAVISNGSRTFPIWLLMYDHIELEDS